MPADSNAALGVVVVKFTGAGRGGGFGAGRMAIGPYGLDLVPGADAMVMRPLVAPAGIVTTRP
jgi:hypothetical protein